MIRYNVYGVGYNSGSKYPTSINDKRTKAYSTWCAMLKRCYDTKYQEKYPTYKGCIVAEEWHNFQNFAKWYYNNYYEIENEKMCLDKDILVKGNKIYSPSTCVIVPMDINNLFVKHNKKRGEYPIGVYKDNNPMLRNKRYKTQIKYKGKTIHLGYFNDPHQAYLMYKINKELLIQGIANEYKELIPKELYNALVNYQVTEED